jgi:hypothetical protein
VLGAVVAQPDSSDVVAKAPKGSMGAVARNFKALRREARFSSDMEASVGL